MREERVTERIRNLCTRSRCTVSLGLRSL